MKKLLAFHTADDSRSRIRRKQYCNSSDMALYPICRSVTLYRSTSACKTGMVGEKPAACRSRMVPVIYHSVCSDL